MKTNSFLKYPLTIITFFSFLVLTVWWIGDSVRGAIENGTTLIPYVYGIIALIGGLYGIFIISRQWGGLKSIVGKSIFFFSLGLLLQAFGQIAYSYYVLILHIEVPYPSLGDIGYFGSIPSYITALFYLAKASGVHLGIKSLVSKIQVIILPLLLLFVGYMLFLKGYEVDWSKPLVVFLDFGYPIGEAIYISLAIITYLLTQGVLGGIMRKRIMVILAALLVQFAADYYFLYQVREGVWQLGGLNEYMYLIAYATMSYALSFLGSTIIKLKRSNR